MDGSTGVLVTGGSGFVGSHLVKRLLERGYRVHATVRSTADTAKVRPLREMQEAHPGQLSLFEADLLTEGSFDEAMTGCRVVFHVASPFRMPEKIKDGRRDMVDPALLGTRHVLAAIERTPTVDRLVLTSTVGTIFGDYADVLAMDDAVLSERYFNTTSTVENNPYHYAKTLAERAARDAEAAQGRWRMVSVNPGLILGPSLTPASESGSLFLLEELFKGYFFYGAPDFSFTTADVREVADAHIAAAENPDAKGRYIVADRTMTSFHEMSRIIRARYPRDLRLPRTALPHWPVRVLGPAFGLTQDYIRKHLGIRFRVDNSRSVNELGITYRPIEQTVLDHYEAWRSQRSAK
ncbi:MULTISPECIES: NAD-dependent epimerase/dehydratase family protein [unclassified Streptomyces]|uniref:NAD-dependent epimerase/dehydratase family protein n=1 Tax=unclassified Streptomyces TaxID=2593676 RepID=UPI0023665555|nr:MULTISPECIES: NAD-dependent epimerase/dehydratase family protein [unclassified Streptomyces]MDF3144693.1 NAD-dependent epimerase/dehydratase family protein [Streptomyces sp. T21Q-yed]WDF36142.1 NAD-dependent epimerase/dehydratase family protein [Streptomyces sp. T12]